MTLSPVLLKDAAGWLKYMMPSDEQAGRDLAAIIDLLQVAALEIEGWDVALEAVPEMLAELRKTKAHFEGTALLRSLTPAEQERLGSIGKVVARAEGRVPVTFGGTRGEGH